MSDGNLVSLPAKLAFGVDPGVVAELRSEGRHGTARVVEAFLDATQLLKPKPVEPTGFGAVVEDAESVRWARAYYEMGGEIWRSGLNGEERAYRNIDVVRVLSVGVLS